MTWPMTSARAVEPTRVVVRSQSRTFPEPGSAAQVPSPPCPWGSGPWTESSVAGETALPSALSVRAVVECSMFPIGWASKATLSGSSNEYLQGRSKTRARLGYSRGWAHKYRKRRNDAAFMIACVTQANAPARSRRLRLDEASKEGRPQKDGMRRTTKEEDDLRKDGRTRRTVARRRPQKNEPSMDSPGSSGALSITLRAGESSSPLLLAPARAGEQPRSTTPVRREDHHRTTAPRWIQTRTPPEWAAATGMKSSRGRMSATGRVLSKEPRTSTSRRSSASARRRAR